MDKKDLEELKKWERQKMNYVETYGVDIFNEKKKNASKLSKTLNKLFNLIYKIAKAILIILMFVVIIGTFALLIWYYGTIYDKMHIDPVSTISGMYNVNVEVVSKNIDDNQNGKYILTTKENPNVHFTAIVNWESMKQDYSDRTQKYYYENWKNVDKNKIKTEERYDENGDILVYRQYIEIENKNQIESSIDLINDFLKFAGKMYFPDWELYYLVSGQRIYPIDIERLNKEDFIKKIENILVETNIN